MLTEREVCELIRGAIRQKKVVIADYDGYRRMMCPHVIGTKHGRWQALFYQFDGGSRSGIGPPEHPKNWRCIWISKLSNVQVVDGDWHTGPNHSHPQTCVDIIDTEVSY